MTTLGKSLLEIPQLPNGRSGFLSFLAISELFSASECAQIIDMGTHRPLKQAETASQSGYVVDQARRNVRLACFERGESDSEWIRARMERALRRSARMFGFDVTEMKDGVKFLVYEAGSHFDTWHMDVGGGATAGRKLSATVELSGPGAYEGGRLELFPDALGDALAVAQGTAILFPSFRCHRVRPVTSGTRYSLVNWIEGPPYR